jgi:hypothetical protein
MAGFSAPAFEATLDWYQPDRIEVDAAQYPAFLIYIASMAHFLTSQAWRIS